MKYINGWFCVYILEKDEYEWRVIIYDFVCGCGSNDWLRQGVCTDVYVYMHVFLCLFGYYARVACIAKTQYGKHDPNICHSIVTSIPARHAGDRGLIPRDGDHF